MASVCAGYSVATRRRGPVIFAALVALCVVAVSGTVSAQSWKRIGVGANIELIDPSDDDVDGAVVIGVSGGLAPEQGWGFAAGLDWFEADLLDGRGADSRRVGTLKVRPLMAGVGYTWLNDQVATTAAVTAGVSLNGGELSDSLARQAPSGGQDYAIDVANSFALRPSLEVEYDLTRRFALTGSASFLFTRPEIVLATPQGRIVDRWNASSFNVLAGLIVYPFR